MTKTVFVISHIGTLGVGIAVGVLCSKAYFEKRESERADKEINSMKESMRKTYSKTVEKEESNKTSEDIATIPIHDVSSAFGYYPATTGIDQRIDSIEARMAEMQHPREEDVSQIPYFIDIDDFDSVTLGYAKKELSYYMDDGTLIDEEENILSIVDTVGSSNLESFENSLESSCYIRNEALKEDYEISKVFGSYGAMLGDD